MRFSLRPFFMAFLPVLAAAALSGCAGPSAPASPTAFMTPLTSPETYGYVEKRLSETTFKVSYVGPELRVHATYAPWRKRAARLAEKTTYDLALWRAAQLSLQSGHPALAVTGSNTEMKRYIVGRDYTIEHTPVFQGLNALNLGYYSATYYKPVVTLTVEMLNKTRKGALDARETAKRIEQEYADLGSGSPVAPGTYYYFGPPAYLHDFKSIEAPAAAPGAKKQPPREQPSREQSYGAAPVNPPR